MKHMLCLLAAVISVSAVSTAVAVPNGAAARESRQVPTPSADPLVGTWRLVEHVNWDASGNLVPQFGPNPIGYFVHDAAGRFSVQIMRTPAVRPFAAGPDGGTLEELRDLFRAYYAAFGTYTVDANRGESIYHVEGSTRPELIGTDVHLPYRREGDSLIIGDGKTARRVWQRVK